MRYVSRPFLAPLPSPLFCENGNSVQWEWTTIAALVAPRPLLFCNSDEDKIFPMDGNRRIIERLRKLYQWYDKLDLVDEYVSHGGHEDRPDLRVAACQWINKHFRGDTVPAGDVDAAPLPGPELRVFLEDKDIPADAINGKIDETFVPKAEVKLPEAGKFEEWKTGLMKELRAKSFRAFPERIPPAKSVYLLDVESFGISMTAKTEPGIQADVYEDPNPKGNGNIRTLIVLNSGEKPAMPEWAKPFTQNTRTPILATRGTGRLAWTEKSPPNYVERAHALLGVTVDEGRVWDVAAVMRRLHDVSEEKTQWRVVGRGQAGILAAYAALIEPSISEVIIVDPTVSHHGGPIFLNVLRVLDVPEALGLLAPRPLTLVNAKDKAFDRTAEIYKLAGAEDKLQRK
jgi:hypothetical protein